MLEKYRIILLKHLLSVNTLIEKQGLKVDDIPDNYISTIVNDLISNDLVFNSIGHIGINDSGKDYLVKSELNDDNIGFANIHIGHIINAPVSNSDLTTYALNNSTATPVSKQEEQSKSNKIINWILSNVWTFFLFVVVGIVIWFFTIYKPIFK